MLIFVSAPAKAWSSSVAWRPLAAAAACLFAMLIAAPRAHAAVIALTPQEMHAMRDRGVATPGAPVPLERLRRVSFSYRDFHGAVHADGNIVVLDAVAPEVQAIFDTLLARGIPLQQARPMESFDGDDEASMCANNSSAFNGRPITGGSAWSKHAYGVAIDVNPVQNPYVSLAAGKRILLPPASGAYLLRKPQRPGMAESMVEIFAQHGFLVWGGNWHEPIDYQHFEIGSRELIARLLALDGQAATQAFAQYARSYRQCLRDKASVAPAGKRRTECIARVRQ